MSVTNTQDIDIQKNHCLIKMKDVILRVAKDLPYAKESDCCFWEKIFLAHYMYFSQETQRGIFRYLLPCYFSKERKSVIVNFTPLKKVSKSLHKLFLSARLICGAKNS